VRVRWVWAFLDLPEEGFEAAVEFWRAVTRTSLSPWRGDRGQFATLRPAEGDPWVKVQRVGGPGGIHVDLDVDVPLEQARDHAAALGARILDEVPDDDTLGVVVCRSPGGFVFCLTRWSPPESSRGQVREGQQSLLDQVCLDIPTDRYAAEVRFWSELTGWGVRDAAAPEFERLDWPPGLPVRFLLQRLDEPSGSVRAHVDLACADVRAECARHVGLGAVEVGPGRGWVVMRDPNGHEYCCTERDPLTGGARHSGREGGTIRANGPPTG
jgi:hypothetical protein